LNCRLIQSRPGRASQQNYGARLASGDVLLFLHADSWLQPNCITQIRRALADSRIGFGAFQTVIEADGLVYRLIERGNSLRARVLSMAFGDQGIFVRRSLFDRVGGFPEVQLMEDVFLVRRLRRRSPLCLLPGPLYTSPRRWQKHGVIRQTMRNWLLLLTESCGVHPNNLARFYATNAE